jgi:hypothetical protein
VAGPCSFRSQTIQSLSHPDLMRKRVMVRQPTTQTEPSPSGFTGRADWEALGDA